MRRVTWALASIIIGAFAAFSAGTPAFAANGPIDQNVHSTITIGESMTVTGFTATVAFPSANPGDTSTVPNAEVLRIITNHRTGTSVTLENQNGGFHEAIGQPDVIQDSSLTVSTASGAHQMTNSGTIVLDSVPVGNNSESQNWALAIQLTPFGQSFAGALQADFTEHVTANPA